MSTSQQGGDSAHASQQYERRHRASAGTYATYHTADPSARDSFSAPNTTFGYAASTGKVPGAQSSSFLYDTSAMAYSSAHRRDYSGDIGTQWNSPSLSVGSQNPGGWHQGYSGQTVPATCQSYDPVGVPVPISSGWTSGPTSTSIAGPTASYTQTDVLGDLVASPFFPDATDAFATGGPNAASSPSWYADHHQQQRPSLSPGRERSVSSTTTGLTEYSYPDDLLSPPPAGLSTGSGSGKQSRHGRSPRSSESMHDGGEFIIMQNGIEKRGYHPPDVWDSHKEIIRQLYLGERRPLKDVVQIMEDTYGFRATPKMYKTKFTTWGFAKNNTEKEAKQILYHKLMRDAQGKRSVFSRHGKQIDLQRYLRRKGVSEMDLVDFDADGTLPPHVRCWTPP